MEPQQISREYLIFEAGNVEKKICNVPLSINLAKKEHA